MSTLLKRLVEASVSSRHETSCDAIIHLITVRYTGCNGAAEKLEEGNTATKQKKSRQQSPTKYNNKGIQFNLILSLVSLWQR